MSKKPTKADLEKHIEKLERDVTREQEIKAELVKMFHEEQAKRDKEMKKILASRKRLRNRLKNVYDLSMVLNEVRQDTASKRVMNTIIRLASGR